MVVSTKAKLALAVLILLVYHFYQSFWLQGAFSDKGVAFNNAPSSLSSLKKQALQPLAETELFGVYEQKDEAEEPETLAQIFASASKEYIGKVGNHQYILYATADFAGRLSAKLLVQNLTSEEVYVKTVKNKDKIENVVVSAIQLSELILTPIANDNNQTSGTVADNQPITLLLFTKKSPAPLASE